MNSLPPNISKLIGQMIMVGIKGHDRDAVYDFFEGNYKYHVGGIILYDEDITTNPPSLHNIRSQQQLSNFTNYLQEFSSNPLLIGIDQEGGKVNRLKEIYGFPKTISWSKLGNINDLKKTELESNNIAKSLNRCGINVNFSPVLDLDISKDNIISQKDRAISSDYKVVFEHAQTLIKCHLDHDIIAVGKHFPGQGGIFADSHLTFSQDTRSLLELESHDLRPFDALKFKLGGIMTAHISFSSIDKEIATFSKFWLQDILRDKMEFTGTIFSDDLSMKGSDYVGGIEAKVSKALESGCNMVLVCNDRPAALKAINFLEKEKISQSEKVTKLKASGSIAWADLENDARRIDIIDKLNTIEKLKL